MVEVKHLAEALTCGKRLLLLYCLKSFYYDYSLQNIISLGFAEL